MVTIKTKKDINSFAHIFLSRITNPAVIGLVGPLGAGKTTLTQAFARECGIYTNITSPTYVIMKEYAIPKSSIVFIHIDAYRLHTNEDIQSVGLEEVLQRKDVIIVIEWADQIRSLLPKKTSWITIKPVDGITRNVDVSYN